MIKRGVDAVTFTSGSTVRHFMTAMRRDDPSFSFPRRTAVACIGPVTAAAARELGVRVDIVPREYTVDSLLESLAQHFREG